MRAFVLSCCVFQRARAIRTTSRSRPATTCSVGWVGDLRARRRLLPARCGTRRESSTPTSTRPSSTQRGSGSTRPALSPARRAVAHRDSENVSETALVVGAGVTGASVAREVRAARLRRHARRAVRTGHCPLGIRRRHPPVARRARRRRLVRAARVARAVALASPAGADGDAVVGADRPRVVRAPRRRLRGPQAFPYSSRPGSRTNGARRPRPPRSSLTRTRRRARSALGARGGRAASASRDPAPRSRSRAARRRDGRARIAPDDEPDADVVVWACGAWLPTLFPDDVEIRVERRDVFFLGGDASWRDTPGLGRVRQRVLRPRRHRRARRRGRARPGERRGRPRHARPRAAGAREDAARDFAARRFPSLAGAPIVGARVCQYDLVLRQPLRLRPPPGPPPWWLFGGGSGHGFKHGPALAEYIADCVEERRGRSPSTRSGALTGDAGLRTKSY